jgi:hypothetical protein
MDQRRQEQRRLLDQYDAKGADMTKEERRDIARSLYANLTREEFDLLTKFYRAHLDQESGASATYGEVRGEPCG